MLSDWESTLVLSKYVLHLLETDLPRKWSQSNYTIIILCLQRIIWVACGSHGSREHGIAVTGIIGNKHHGPFISIVIHHLRPVEV